MEERHTRDSLIEEIRRVAQKLERNTVSRSRYDHHRDYHDAFGCLNRLHKQLLNT